MRQTPNPQARVQPIGRAFDLPAPLRLWHLTSLDAPTVAVVWALAFAKADTVELPLWLPLLLGLVTWCVYVGDRLLDARSALRAGQIQSLRLRHRFHWRHRRALIPLACIAACAAVWIILSFMPTAARARNSLLALAGAIYFSGVHAPTEHKSMLPKELIVALLFAAGCALPVLGRGADPSFAFMATLLFFAALAWLNCHAIDRWESPRAGSSHPSIQSIAILLAVAGLLDVIALAAAHSSAAALLATGIVSAALLALLDSFRGRLTPLALRAAADLVLLTPFVLLLR